MSQRFIAPLASEGDFPREPSINPEEIDAAIKALQRLREHLGGVAKNEGSIPNPRHRETFFDAEEAVSEAFNCLTELSMKLPDMLVTVTGEAAPEGFSVEKAEESAQTVKEFRAARANDEGSLVSYASKTGELAEVDGLVIEYIKDDGAPEKGVRPISIKGKRVRPEESRELMLSLDEVEISEVKQAEGEAMFPRDEYEAANRARVLEQAIKSNAVGTLKKAEFLRGWYACAFLAPFAKPQAVSDGCTTTTLRQTELEPPDDKYATPCYEETGWPVALAPIVKEAVFRKMGGQISGTELEAVFSTAQKRGNVHRETAQWIRGMEESTGLRM